MSKGSERAPRPAEQLPTGTRQFTGSLDGRGLRIGIASGRFNPDLVHPLVQGTVEALVELGLDASDIDVAWVPGTFEVPTVLRKWAASRRYHALIAHGVVIEGATVHAQTIGDSVARELMVLQRVAGLPVIDAVVVTPDVETATTRCIGEAARGRYAAAAAVEMVRLMEDV